MKCGSGQGFTFCGQDVGRPNLEVYEHLGLPPCPRLRKRSKGAHDRSVLQGYRIWQGRADIAPSPQREENLHPGVVSVTRSAASPSHRMAPAVPPRCQTRDLQELVLQLCTPSREQVAACSQPLSPCPSEHGLSDTIRPWREWPRLPSFLTRFGFPKWLRERQ